MSHPLLARHVAAGEALRPWIMLGPHYEDCSAEVIGLTRFERLGSSIGQEVVDAATAEGIGLLTKQPYDGDQAHFRGITHTWSLARLPEPYHAWGSYYISNHLGVVLLSTTINAGATGVRRWRLEQRINARVVLTLDGQVIFDSDQHQLTYQDGTVSYHFEAEIPAGEHRLGAVLVRLARSAQVGILLTPLDGDLEVRVPLAAGSNDAERAALETDLAAMALPRDLFQHEAEIALDLPERQYPLPIRAVLRGPDQPRVYGNDPLILLPGSGQIVAEVLIPADASGRVPICKAADLPDSSYILTCEWLAADQRVVAARSFDLRKVRDVHATPGPDGTIGYAERRQAALSFLSTSRDWHPSPPIWNQVARYALSNGHNVDEAAIAATCEFIAARKDCADFAIQGLLRIMVWEQRQQRLSDAINATMKATILGFKYWVDEPGDTVMYMGSENHRFLFHVAEWIAGQLFPLDEFSNSQQRGLFHALKGRTYITEWIRQRGRYGFDEWHSNAYYPICIAPLLNVYDFAIAEDYKLQEMAGSLLDVMLFNLAADSYRGTFGATHGRSYALYCKYAEMDDTASTCWLLWGTGALVAGPFGMGPVSLATSSYTPPAILNQIANDASSVVESRQRQGLLHTSSRNADFVTYRTPDYMLSAVQDHRKGEYESSTHIAQITLPNRAAIFWTCPQTSSEGAGLRPDYWSGNTTLPRVISYRNLVAFHWRLNQFAWMTHCLFEQDRFDQVEFRGNWAFARAEDGYVAIWASGGLRIGRGGQYSNRELVCDARVVTWLAECGRAADWGSFEQFIAAISSSVIESDGTTLRYHSPSQGVLVSGWDGQPTINGQAISLHGYPLLESPWGTSRFGSGEMVLRYAEQEHELWLNQ
ncbi:MAG: hypothetical protein Fur005_19150 [Roseiflexaceae bacterium]